MKKDYFEKKFYGSTVVGKKGQVVIPKEIRDKLNLKEKSKLLVFLLGKDVIALMKFSDVEKIAKLLEKKLIFFKKLIKNKK